MTQTQPDSSTLTPDSDEAAKESSSSSESPSSESAIRPSTAETGIEATPPEDTGDPTQNQAQTQTPRPAEPPKVETHLDRMRARQARLEEELKENEARILAYVYQRYPAAFYRRWKLEANEFFNLAVIYRLRSHRRGKTTSKR